MQPNTSTQLLLVDGGTKWIFIVIKNHLQRNLSYTATNNSDSALELQEVTKCPAQVTSQNPLAVFQGSQSPSPGAQILYQRSSILGSLLS